MSRPGSAKSCGKVHLGVQASIGSHFFAGIAAEIGIVSTCPTASPTWRVQKATTESRHHSRFDHFSEGVWLGKSRRQLHDIIFSQS